MNIDRTVMIRTVDERIDKTTNSLHRDQLKVLRAHMAAEVVPDIDGLVATISPKRSQYRIWGSESPNPSGREEIRAFYADKAERGVLYFQYDIEHLAVDEGIIVTDGVMTSLMPVGGDVHKMVMRMAIFWPFDDNGLLIGEESHTTVLSSEKVELSELPEDYPVEVLSH